MVFAVGVSVNYYYEKAIEISTGRQMLSSTAAVATINLSYYSTYVYIFAVITTHDRFVGILSG